MVKIIGRKINPGLNKKQVNIFSFSSPDSATFRLSSPPGQNDKEIIEELYRLSRDIEKMKKG